MMRQTAAVSSPLIEPRKPPANIEAEQALLGAILLNNDAFERVADIIEQDHFYDPLHGRIYVAIRDAIRAGRLADARTLAAHFAHEPPMGGDKGLPVPIYLGRLIANATSIINARDYAKTIVELKARRELILIGEETVNLAYDSPTDMPSAVQIDLAESRLFTLGKQGAVSTHDFTMAQAVDSSLAMIHAAYKGGNRLAGLPTGFYDLDRDLGGLCNSDLIIIAGRPSMGKSALAAQVGFNVAKRLAEERDEVRLTEDEDGRKTVRGGEVLFFSLEMSAEQLAMRQIAMESQIAGTRLRVGALADRAATTSEERARSAETTWRHVEAEAKKIAPLPFHIDTTGAISVAQLTARARRRKRLHNTRLVIIDYLQLMVSGERAENRVAEVTKITTGLKAMAKELGVPVIALSQLSRQCENREDKRPQLSDLRESGSIEQDADIVLAVYRDEYYLARGEPPREKADKYAQWLEEMDQVKGIAEIIRLKHRHGSVGTTKLHFKGDTTEFSCLERADRDLTAGGH